jgi:hypothetical protein
LSKEKKSLEALLQVGTAGGALEVSRPRIKHPKGWTPGLELGKESGVLVTEPLSEQPSDWDAILAELLPDGFNVSDYEIDGQTVEVRAWDGNVGNGELKRFYYFKARIKKRGDSLPEAIDIEDIILAARNAKPKAVKTTESERVYGFQLTDLQAGQADGDGVEGMVARALQIAKIVEQDLADLKNAGTPANSIFIPITGDLVEGIIGWYETQTFSVALDRRQQVKLVRRLLADILTEVASFGLPVHVATVPGNHGENRHNGKTFTSFGDNDDVAVVEQIAEAFALSGKFSHVSFSFPDHERLSLTVEVLGWIVGLTHGHVARAGAGVEGKILAWFKSMAATRDPIGDSDLLFTGHYHHPRFQSLIGDTYWIQGGALCDRSSWFSQSFGLVSDPCFIRFTITRSQRVEKVLPYFWSRTTTQTRTIGE